MGKQKKATVPVLPGFIAWNSLLNYYPKLLYWQLNRKIHHSHLLFLGSKALPESFATIWKSFTDVSRLLAYWIWNSNRRRWRIHIFFFENTPLITRFASINGFWTANRALGIELNTTSIVGFVRTGLRTARDIESFFVPHQKHQTILPKIENIVFHLPEERFPKFQTLLPKEGAGTALANWNPTG